MDVKDRLIPSITYLQRLGTDHLDTVFQHSRWIFHENAEMALEVSSFTRRSQNLLIQKQDFYLRGSGPTPATCSQFPRERQSELLRTLSRIPHRRAPRRVLHLSRPSRRIISQDDHRREESRG